MKPIEQVLREWECPQERRAVVRLARSLHRIGMRRRQSTPEWQRQGFRDCKDARDLVTFARFLPNNS